MESKEINEIINQIRENEVKLFELNEKEEKLRKSLEIQESILEYERQKLDIMMEKFIEND
jgi:hypothetical protein